VLEPGRREPFHEDMIAPAFPGSTRCCSRPIGWLGILSLSCAALPFGAGAASAPTWVYFGTYTGARSKGIYVSRFEPNSGRISSPELAAEVVNPTFLALHPNGRFLYAVNEVDNFQGQPGGAVSAFAIDQASGRLSLLNQESTRGGGPCHLTVDPSGKAVLVANYSGGSIAALPVQEDGRLGAATAFVQHTGSSVHPQRQTAPHAHGIYVDAANGYVFVPDLGIDKVLVYRWDPAQLSLQAHNPPAAPVAPGAGPRHFTFHPNASFAYVINELLSTVTAFRYDSTRGTLHELQTIRTLPDDFSGNSTTAEIQIHPSGRFLYGSNRGHDSLAIYRIDTASGHLTLLGHESTLGRTPRNFSIDPTGQWLLAANQDSNTVVVFRLDPETGRLEATGQDVQVGAPVCVVYLPAR
jgi:6-phosphogluconolactonase